MNDIQDTIVLLLQLQEDVTIDNLNDMALAVLAIRELNQLQGDLRKKLRTTKAQLDLEETIELSQLIKASGIMADEPMSVKRYTGGKVSWDRDVR